MLFAKAEKVQMSGYAGRDGRRWRDGWESGWSRGFRRYIVFGIERGIERGPNNKSGLRSPRSFHQNLFQTQFMFKRSRNEDDTNGPGRGKYKRTKYHLPNLCITEITMIRAFVLYKREDFDLLHP